jgi:hypothetical protein
MAYLTIQINASGIPVADMSSKLLGGDATKPREIVQQLINLLSAIEGGEAPASISASSSTVAGTVSGQTGGVGPITLNLT